MSEIDGFSEDYEAKTLKNNATRMHSQNRFETTDRISLDRDKAWRLYCINDLIEYK